MPALENCFSLSFGTGSVKDRLKCIKSGQRILIAFEPLIPLFFSRLLESITSAALISTFLGSHPRRAHVPPKAFAFWVFKYYGYDDVRLMNGGRKKWLLEDRPMSKEIPRYAKGNFRASEADNSIRVFLNYVTQSLEKVRNNTVAMVDVRSPKEFTGEILAPPEYPTEHAQRGGHIPGAKNIPWSQAVNDNDGTFKSTDELKKLYESNGITLDKEVVAYCRIGERSSHTWFVLKYLLGYPNVKNYDGSWTEWGNMINNPVEK